MCIFNSYGFNLLGIQREKYVKVVISWVSLLNPREQKKKENIPVLQDTDWDKGAMKVGMCVCVCTHMCVLPQEGKPTEEKIQEAKNALKGLASREK